MKTQTIYSLIPVEERLPEKDGMYVCTSEGTTHLFYAELCTLRDDEGQKYWVPSGKWKGWLEGPKERIVLTPEEMREEMWNFYEWAHSISHKDLGRITKSGFVGYDREELYDLYIKSKEQ